MDQNLGRVAAVDVERDKEEGGGIREYKAMHEENSLSSWLDEVEKGKTKGEVDEETRGNIGKKGKESG